LDVRIWPVPCDGFRRIIIGLPFLRASATSRITSLAALLSPQSKADANKGDDASPFALLVNSVQAAPPAQQKDGQSSQNPGDNTKGDAASQSASSDAAIQPASQIVSQGTVKSAKPAKSDDKGAGNNDGKAAGNSGSNAPAQLPVQPLSIIIAANNTANQDTLVPPVGPATGTATSDPARKAGGPAAATARNAPTGSQSAAQPTPDISAGQISACQVGLPQIQPQASNQNTAPLPPVSPQVPAASQNTAPNDTTQSGAIEPPVPQIQAPGAIQNNAQTNTLSVAVTAANAPTPLPPIVQAGFQSGPDQTRIAQPKISQQKQPPAADTNTVQLNAIQPGTVQTNGQQKQALQVPTNSVQPIAIPPDAAGLTAPPTQADATPVTPGQSSNKSAKKTDDKSDSHSGDSVAAAALQQAGAQAQQQVQPPIQPSAQPDPSQIAALAANAAAAANDDAGGDEAGVVAAGTAGIAASGQANQSSQSSRNTQNTQAPLAGAPQPQSQTQESQAQESQAQDKSGSPQASLPNQAPPQPSVQPLKPWQTKTQNANADGTGGKADSSQTDSTSPASVKPAAPQAPQSAAATDVVPPRPADTANNSLPLIAGAGSQAQQGPQAQAGNAPAIAQNLQVTTPSPNLPALAVEIAARSQSGAKQFDIRLDPPELGRVEIRLSIDATGKASAHLSADQPQTLDLLQKDAPTLTRALRDAGLNVSQNGLNFSLRQQPGDAGAGNNQSRGGNGRSFTLAATSNVDATSTSAAWRTQASGRLDIRV
jgi:flagellar hook-length control protein FliK